jgi:hypothetical protein
MTHSFFAQMGGFAFDTKTHSVEYIPGSPRLYLTANGIAMLAQLGRLPSISKEYILDKSKADNLAKALATIQASWLIVQCIGRTVGGLPITLLEYNTLAHALCSLVMYCLWWSKPLNITDPMVLSDDWVPSVCAAMWMLSEVSTFAPKEDVKPPEIAQFIRYERCQDSRGSIGRPCSAGTGDHVIEIEPVDAVSSTLAGVDSIHLDEKSQDHPEPKHTLTSSDIIIATSLLEPDRLIDIQPGGFLINDERGSHHTASFRFTRNRVLLPVGFSLDNLRKHFPQHILDDFFTHPVARKCPTSVTVNRATLTRWFLATQCYDSHKEAWAQHKVKLSDVSARDGTAWTTSQYPVDKCRIDYVDAKIPNWPGNDLAGNNAMISHILFGTACTLLYATIHAIAWTGYFPTPIERTMWIISAVGIGGSAVVWLLVYFLWSWMDKTIVNRKGLVGRCMEYGFLVFRTVFAPMSTCIACALCAFYVFARFFLVFEAFFSLRALPLEMYLAPQWTQYISHL